MPTFLSWLGVGLSSTLFFSLLYGCGNKYNYKIVKKKISLNGLTLAFKGFKIIHISDIHSGSLKDKSAVLKGIELIEKQNGGGIISSFTLSFSLNKIYRFVSFDINLLLNKIK